MADERRVRRRLTWLISALALIVGGCAGDPPKPAPGVTPEQVRGHSDRTFDKLKQEEQGRTGGPAGSP